VPRKASRHGSKTQQRFDGSPRALPYNATEGPRPGPSVVIFRPASEATSMEPDSSPNIGRGYVPRSARRGIRTPEWARLADEALCRLDGLRPLLDYILQGRVMLTPELTAALVLNMRRIDEVTRRASTLASDEEAA
jgi:hypothetical protein